MNTWHGFPEEELEEIEDEANKIIDRIKQQREQEGKHNDNF